MFDERHLQLVSTYAKSSEYFARNVIAPLIDYVRVDTIEQWNKRARIELGKETYALKLDGYGGYFWTKIDPLTNKFVPVDQVESQKVEKFVEESLANTKAHQKSPASTESLSLNTSTTNSSTNIFSPQIWDNYNSEIEF